MLGQPTGGVRASLSACCLLFMQKLSVLSNISIDFQPFTFSEIVMQMLSFAKTVLIFNLKDVGGVGGT